MEYGGDYKTKWELDDKIALDSEILELENDLLEAETKKTVIDAIAENYEGLRNAASREMYRRGVERAPND